MALPVLRFFGELAERFAELAFRAMSFISDSPTEVVGRRMTV